MRKSFATQFAVKAVLQDKLSQPGDAASACSDCPLQPKNEFPGQCRLSQTENISQLSRDTRQAPRLFARQSRALRRFKVE
ncbi:hypothetical protein CCHR01_01538 [Colletotrichum chrysophilum]|uniref:Uncharacterized protein n=1 Tax=Colletotrichum chrysophilum TaxID=1836956 RepID=A0AAD9AYX3_9PEZI|nr:hypothetical protein CCHR01_01538 [Colletotrichum chrysophilum]